MVPLGPVVPRVPLVPVVPQVSLVIVVPSIPLVPQVPSVPVVPQVSVVPQVPLVPQVPVVPQVSLVPVVPVVPEVPLVPVFLWFHRFPWFLWFLTFLRFLNLEASAAAVVLPHVILWHPIAQFPMFFQHEVLCPAPDCTQTLSLCHWNSGSSAGNCPRFLHDMEHIPLFNTCCISM